MKRLDDILRFLKAKENRLGVIVLFIGLMALIIVGIMALGGLSGGKSTTERFYQDQAENQRKINRPENVQPVTQEKPKYKRQADITEAQIQGAWEIEMSDGKALLQINQGTYKLAIISNSTAAPNRYSLGRYVMRDDLLVLTPNSDYKLGRSQFPGYRNLTTSKFSFMVLKRGGKLVLQKPTRDMGVYIPPRHVFLNMVQDEVAVFSILK